MYISPLVDIPPGKDTQCSSEDDTAPIQSFRPRAHLSPAFCNHLQSATDEDVDQQLGRDNGRCDSETQRLHGWKGRHCAVGERVRERAETDHDEQFQAVMLEGERQSGEAFVIGDEALHKLAQDCS